MSQFRNFTFTFNNYPNTELVDSVVCKYIIYGKEVGESGTPHLQGFLCFATMKSLKQVIKLLPGCHVEVARSAIYAIEYCKKDGQVTERGEAPVSQEAKGQKEKVRWELVLKAAQEGRVQDIPEEIRFKYDRNIERIHCAELKKRKLEDTEEKHLWYYGSTGTGKSRRAREENPELYLKMCNKWWDGYDDQSVVLLEDFDKAHSGLCHHLKIWADRYPFPAEFKGGSKTIRPTKFIVTSNYHPAEIWPDSADFEPIKRRFEFVCFDTVFKKYADCFNPPCK